MVALPVDKFMSYTAFGLISMCDGFVICNVIFIIMLKIKIERERSLQVRYSETTELDRSVGRKTVYWAQTARLSRDSREQQLGGFHTDQQIGGFELLQAVQVIQEPDALCLW